jgi:hypothetical protein
MLSNSGMQFALAVQPLALPDPDDDPVLVGDSRLTSMWLLWHIWLFWHVCTGAGGVTYVAGHPVTSKPHHVRLNGRVNSVM